MSEEQSGNVATEGSLCGPFDRQFRRKFLGQRSTSLLSERNKLLRSPALHLLPSASDTLLPKIREIEKIARSGGKKPVKRKAEVISDLELYLAKKLISNQTTRELITRIEASTLRHDNAFLPAPDRKYSQTSSKFYSADQDGLPTRTAYSPPKKWISDQEFREKFDRFVVKPHEEESETVRLNDLFGSQQLESPEQLRSRIQSDRGALRDIVKRMIEQQNEESEPEEDQRPALSPANSQSAGRAEGRGIRWIIQKCQDYQRAAKHKSKRPSKAANRP